MNMETEEVIPIGLARAASISPIRACYQHAPQNGPLSVCHPRDIAG